MARVTVEDCIMNVPDRFELVLLAAQRAKQIATGNPLTVDRDNDKDSVVALREIAEETVSIESLKEDVLNSFSRRRFVEPRMQDDAPAAVEDKTAREIEETFAEETRHPGADSDVEADGIVAEGGATVDGMSFGDDDVQVED